MNMMDILIANGANVNVRDSLRHTPLHLVPCLDVEFKIRKEMAELLIDRGADIDAKGRADKTPLMYALICGDNNLAELMIIRGAKLQDV